jgi:hypothetical protein
LIGVLAVDSKSEISGGMMKDKLMTDSECREVQGLLKDGG